MFSPFYLSFFSSEIHIDQKLQYTSWNSSYAFNCHISPFDINIYISFPIILLFSFLSRVFCPVPVPTLIASPFPPLSIYPPPFPYNFHSQKHISYQNLIKITLLLKSLTNYLHISLPKSQQHQMNQINHILPNALMTLNLFMILQTNKNTINTNINNTTINKLIMISILAYLQVINNNYLNNLSHIVNQHHNNVRQQYHDQQMIIIVI